MTEKVEVSRLKKSGHCVNDIGGRLGGELDDFTRCGMRKRKHHRMKQCASRPHTQTTILCRIAVKFIPDDRTAEIGRVNANLMGAARFDDELNKRNAGLFSENRPLAHRPFPVRNIDGHALRIPRLAADRVFDPPRFRLRGSVQNGEIRLSDTSVGFERLAKRAIGSRRLCENHNSAGADIKTMDHARTLAAAAAVHSRSRLREMIRERIIGMPRSGMNYHSRRLADDDDIGILENYFRISHTLERNLSVHRTAAANGSGNAIRWDAENPKPALETRSAAVTT